MHPSRRRRASYASRRSSSGGATALLLLCALLVVAVMGVTVQGRKRAHAEPARPPAPPATAVVVERVETPAPVVKTPRSLVSTITRTVRDAERQTKSLRGRKRDGAFTRTQTSTMASLSTARQELGAWLDEHPDDTRANKLWDRLQRVYIALKKL